MNCYIFVNGVEICKFKVKDSQIKAAPLCLANASKDVSVFNIKKAKLHGYAYDYDSNDVDDILNIHKY